MFHCRRLTCTHLVVMLLIGQKLRIVAIALIIANFSGHSYAKSFYSIQSAVITAKSNSPLLKAEGYNINLAQSNLTTARLHTNPALNNQSLQLMNSKYYPAGTEFSNPLNRQVWRQLTKPFILYYFFYLRRCIILV